MALADASVEAAAQRRRLDEWREVAREAKAPIVFDATVDESIMVMVILCLFMMRYCLWFVVYRRFDIL